MGFTRTVHRGVIATIAHHELRRRLSSYAALALIVTSGGGAAIGAAVAAHRTDRAYPDYLARAEVADLGINPSVSSVAMREAMRNFDGVEQMHSSALLLAVPGAQPPRAAAELFLPDPDTDWLQVLGSPDGRFVDVDRPAVTEGRLPSGPAEAFVNHAERRILERSLGRPLEVGDTIELSFYWAGLGLPGLDPPTTVAPIGVETLRISGFGQLADEVLPDELYPRQRLLVSADIARAYSCTADYRPEMSDAEALGAAVPPGCAQQYWLYSFQLDGVAGTGASIRGQFADAAERLSAELPPWISDQAGYFYISQDRAGVDTAVQRATRPTVTALRVFAVVAAAATVALFGIALSRVLRHSEPDWRSLLQLGASRSQRVIGALAPIVAALAIGAAGAVGVAAVLSPLGPIGSVRTLVPSLGPGLPLVLTAGAAAGLVAVTAATATVIVMLQLRRSAGASPLRRRAPVRVSALVSRASRPAMTTGVSAALDLARSGTSAAIAGCVVTAACVVGTLGFGGHLAALVERPVDYGWPWDVAVITNGGFDSADAVAVAATLDGDPDVDSYRLHALDSSSQFGDRGVPTVYGLSGDTWFEFPVIDGRPPQRPDEAVLGTRTAERLGLGIGAEVVVRSEYFPDSTVSIVGTAVLPPIGSFASDRAGLGDGAYVLKADEPTPDWASFIGIDLRSGVRSGDFLDGIAPDVPGWSLFGSAPLTYSNPVRSPEIVNVSELRAAPQVLGAVLGAALLGGLAVSIVISVRDRHRELAILRALGVRDAELRASVRWQASTMMLVGLIVGLPAGVVAGEAAWSAFADQLGVVAHSAVSLWTVAGTAVGGMLLALLAAAAPARTAIRTARLDLHR